MEEVASGDENALGVLIDRYWKPLVTFAFRYLGDVDSAEDVVQEGFSRIWIHRDRWKSGGVPSAYLYRIVRNLALQEQEKRGVRQQWAQLRQPEDGGLSPADTMESKRILLALENAVRQLPPRRREVLVLSRFHGMSYKEIAEVMGITVQTVANQMSAALRELREALGHLKP